jgi:hypothetical protein
MAKHELYSVLDGGIAYSAEANICNDDTDGQGAAVDLKGFGSALVLFVIGNSGDTLSGSLTIEPIIEESDTDSNYTVTAAANLKGDSMAIIDAPTSDTKVIAVAYMGSKRYIKPRLDTVGTHTVGTPIAIVVLRGHPYKV